ncbi:Corrinoid adenosyltransferase OS=Streptomyces tendae OX=1932 GN=GUR47_13975 PE=3 SV=1 [Streptomyces tendae]
MTPGPPALTDGQPERIYTRTGDQGTTALGDMSRAAKTDLRISAYADANEANAVIGTAIALGGLPEEVVKVLVRVQNNLFDVGADLSTPVVENPEYPPLRVEQFYVDKLEADCDRYLAEVEKLRSSSSPVAPPARPCCTRRARWSAGPSSPPRRRWMRPASR